MDAISAEVLRKLVDRSERRALQLILTARQLPATGSPLHGCVQGLTVCHSTATARTTNHGTCSSASSLLEITPR